MSMDVVFAKERDPISYNQDALTIVQDDGCVITAWEPWKESLREEVDYDIIFAEIAKRFNKVPTIEHKCHNCGGTLEIKADQGIFKCPYCHSVYAIGTARINDRG